MRFFLAFVLATALPAASVDGISIHSTTTGRGNKTIILVHGWTCDESTWESQVPVLSKDFRVITLDLPGHGKSGAPKNGSLTMELFARAVDAVRAEAKADRAVVVGHSMGTPVVIEYHRLFPQHTAGLVYVDGPAHLGSGPGAPNPDAVAGPDGKHAREQMIRGMFSAATTPAMQQHILGMMLAPPESTAVGAMKATFDPAVWKEEVIQTPTLGIYADHSFAADKPYMQAHYPNLEFVVLPGTGHFLMLEKPEEFNRLVGDFARKVKY